LAFSYGDPSKSVNLLGPKPPCWGTSKYDNEDRECRACGFQNTCRDQVLKSRPSVVTPAPTGVGSFFHQYQAPAAYTVPQPMAVQSAPVPQQQFVKITPAAPQAAKPVVQVPQVGQFSDRFGQFQDPMFTTIKATPSIMRPQFPSETFATRVAKNMALAGLESAIGELFLGVRQFVWAPRRDDQDQEK